MASKPTEAIREPGTTMLQGPVIGDIGYVRAGNHTPAGGNVRLNIKPAPVEDEPKPAPKKSKPETDGDDDASA